MSFKKSFVHNRKVDQRFNRRVNLTQKMSKIERRWERLRCDKTLYGRAYTLTRDRHGDMEAWCCYLAILGGYIFLPIIFGSWAVVAGGAGASSALPISLLIMAPVLSTWLLTMRHSYNGYWLLMKKHLTRKAKKLSAARDSTLPATFMSATTLALGKKHESDVAPIAKANPGFMDELFAAYQDKVDAIDSLKDDEAAYREGFDILVNILKQDTEDIRAVESRQNEAQRQADDRQAAQDRQQRRAEAERVQNVLSDLHSYHDTYKQLGA